MLDLFNHQSISDDFSWLVAVFRADGASETICRANDIPLKTYYPVRFNGNGEPKPLWNNYLFIEYQKCLTLQICRATTKFLKIISMRDEEGTQYPVLVRKNAINENLELVKIGKFNDRSSKRRFYGKGSMVYVIDGNFLGKRIRLEMDIPSNMPGNRKVAIDINGWKGNIELWKLSL